MEAPSTPYITHDELAACCEAVNLESAGDDPNDTLFARQVASSMMFYATAQQFPAPTTTYVRPCWSCAPCGSDIPRAVLDGGVWYNRRCNGKSCGCSERSELHLYNWDVSEVLAVYVNGEEVDPANYYVLGGNRIVLVGGARFPECQVWDRPAFPELQSGSPPLSAYADTWGIKFTQGVNVPGILKQAVIELACHFQNLCPEGCNTCEAAVGFSTNSGNIDLAFQGVLPFVFTGIPAADWAVKVLNPYGFNRTQARIWSPEAPVYVTER